MRWLAWFLPLLVTLTMLIPLPVWSIADPDSDPQVNSVYVFENLLETGDVGLILRYNLEYAVLPAETATEAYIATLVDTDGTTQLRSVAPYSYTRSGYGSGVAWIYFDAVDVATYSLSSASVALYEIWLSGNPTCCSGSGGWTGDPPKTIAYITDWVTTGDPNVRLALQVLSYAQDLETAWTSETGSPVDVIEQTSQGNRLSSIGEAYFDNVIPNLRIMAPSAYSAATLSPTIEDVDYSRTFGATATSGDATVDGSPVTLAAGSNTINVSALGATGSFTITLNASVTGTITNGTGTVTGSPVTLVEGVNNLTATVIGDFTVVVNLATTQSGLTSTVTGTGLDLSTAAARFGMSTIMFSGLVWILVTVGVCAAVAKNVGNRKVMLLVFDLCIVGGTVLGLLTYIVAALLFIAFGALTGYVLFFQKAYF